MAKRKRPGNYKPHNAGRPRAGALPAPTRSLSFPDWVAVSVAVLIAATPLLRGLYFPTQQLWAVMAAAVIACATWMARPAGRRRLVRGPADWAVYLLPAAYLLSAFVSVDPNGAVQSLLNHLLYALVFFAAAELALASARTRWIVWHGVLAAGCVVAVTGMVGAAGWAKGLSWFPTGQDRMYTSIQYPDAAAAYLAAGAFIAAGLLMRTANRWARVGYRIAMALMLFTFLAGLSRGATLALLPALAVFIVLLGPGRRAEGIGGLLVAGAAAVAGAVPYFAHLPRGTHANPPGPAAVLEAMVALAVVGAALELGWSQLRAAARPLVVAIVGGVAVIGVAGGAVYELHRHALSGGVGRLLRLGLTSSYNAWSRLAWWRDALKMVAARPILGWGGGGWAAAYQAFERYDYSSTQVHNGWLQIWVSTGTVGFLVWLAFWAALVALAWQAYHRLTPDERPRLAALGAGVAMIGIHGMLDFTLSLSAVSVGLWAMAGLLRSEALEAAAPIARGRRRPESAPVTRNRRRPEPAPIWPAVGLYSVAAAIIFLSASRLVAISDYNQAAKFANQNKLAQTQERVAAAIGADPLMSAAWVLRGEVLSAQAQGTGTANAASAQQLFTEAGTAYARAVALVPYNWNWRQSYAQYLQLVGNNTAAVAQLQTAVADAPFAEALYQALGVAWMRSAVADVQGGHASAATPELSALRTLAAQRAALPARIPVRAVEESKVDPAQVPPVAATVPGLQLSLGEAAALQGQWTTAQPLLEAAAGQSGQLGGEANLWLGLVAQKLGQTPLQYFAAAQKGLGSTYSSELSTVQAVIGKVAG